VRRALNPARVDIRLPLVVALILALAGGATPVAAQVGLSITTPFPSVSVQPGASVSFEITISASATARVDLAVEGLPDGWTASLSGGGNEVQSVFVRSGSPAVVTLDVNIADDAAPGTTSIAVAGRAGDEVVDLPLDLTVAEAAGGTATLESDYPSLRGSVDQEFLYNLTLNNETPQQLTFALSAQGPQGWEVTVQPSGETRAASVTVDARANQRLEVRTTPPAETPEGSYPITVDASAGDYRATAELVVEVTGSVEMTLTTPDERLNTTASAGAATDFVVRVINDGTSPLTGVQLSGSGPSEWEITFDPEVIEEVPPGGSMDATAHITPSGNAVAGDYAVTLSASAESANESVDIRVGVETPPIWGLIGAALIVATLGGLVWVFRRYGRR
jgi:uncharacterized membrane protein